VIFPTDMINRHHLVVSLLLALLLQSCYINDQIRIETFQRLETSWDHMLLDDMRREASTVGSIDFRFNVAKTTEEQINQIRDAIRHGTKAIVVNPYDGNSLLPAIEEAYDAGVYVVLVGQRIPTFKYHAFSGVDNMSAGDKAAKYVSGMVFFKGNIVILGVDSDAPFYQERYDSFKRTLEQYPDVRVVGEIVSDWSKESAHIKMDSLKTALGNTKVNLVFAFGDTIMGAIESGAYPEAIHVGMDGVPGVCLDAVMNGSLNATFMNPTGGRDAITAAICLVRGLPFTKDNSIMPTLVNIFNSDMVKNNILSLSNYEQKIDFLSSELNGDRRIIGSLQAGVLVLILISVVLLGLTLLFQTKNKNNKKSVQDLESKAVRFEKLYNDIYIQKEIAESMRWQLESERDALIEASCSPKDNEVRDVIAEAKFLKDFRTIIEKHIDNSGISIDDIAAELKVSRAQLFRKIKAQSGSTPNELLQSTRLEKARQLLQAGDRNISEIAYAVGFTSPSYFSKCYKDRFGSAPSVSQEK